MAIIVCESTSAPVLPGLGNVYTVRLQMIPNV